MAVWPGGLVLAALVGGVGILLWGGCLWILATQQRALWAFEETTGRIVTATVGPADPPWYLTWLADSAADAAGTDPTDTDGTDHPYGDAPLVEYEYAVDGETHTADTIWPAGIAPTSEQLWGSASDFARRIAADYAAGDEVTVYYDPRDPDAAFLRRERNVVGAMILLMVGTVPVAYIVQFFL